MRNLILDTDSYKASHSYQMPPGTTSMFSYLESRGSRLYDKCIFFGLQYLLKEYLDWNRSGVLEPYVDEAADFFAANGLPFPKEGWLRIANDLKGKLPVRIRAVPEGTVVPLGNALMTIESTDPETFWVVNWLETMLVRLWYPITVATRSWYVKHDTIIPMLERTSDLKASEAALFMLHDFGSRGSTSRESAAIGGASHLVNFRGSDTNVAVRLLNDYYQSDMAGFSIPAMEHSTVTSWGEENEEAAYRNMLSQFGKPGALVAFVSDSYDIYNAVDKIWGQNMKQEVIDSGATVVIRPDSGDPVHVVLYLLRSLANSFGYRTNDKGFSVLNNVRIIQGDGMDEDMVGRVLRQAALHRFSAENMAFGMGGGLIQDLNRDTLQFAFKCSSIMVDGQERDVYKRPVTDTGKSSKRGRLDLIHSLKVPRHFETQQLRWGLEAFAGTAMRTVFENGEVVVDDTLDNIRERADRG